MEIREFAEKFIEAEEAAFQRGEFEALEELEDPNVVYHMVERGDIVGHEAHKQDIMVTRQVVSDFKQTFDYVTGDGSVFVIAYTSSGRLGEVPGSPEMSGKKISMDALWAVQVRNGKVTEVWTKGATTLTD